MIDHLMAQSRSLWRAGGVISGRCSSGPYKPIFTELHKARTTKSVWTWTSRPIEDYPVTSRVRQEVREGKAHTRAIRSRMRSGMLLEKALDEHRFWMLARGETLDGYIAHFKPSTISAYARVRRWWEEDTEFLNVLVRAALLKNSGHAVDERVILNNRAFFQQIRTPGVTI